MEKYLIYNYIEYYLIVEKKIKYYLDLMMIQLDQVQVNNFK